MRPDSRRLPSPARASRVAALVVVALALVAGCRGEPAHPVARWTLEVGQERTEVTVPAHLPVPGHDLTYVLRAEVPVPPALRGQPAELVIPYFAARASLTVDGEPAVATGHALSERYRGTSPKIWALPAHATDRRTVTLVLSVEHRWTQSGWLDTVPRLQRAEAHDPTVAAIRFLNEAGALGAVFSLALVGILYLAIYLVDRRRKAYLWFASQGLLATIYPLVMSGYSQELFGRYDVAVLQALLPAAAISAVAFNHHALRLGPVSPGWAMLAAFNGGVAVVAAGPFAATHVGIKVTVISIVITAIYQVWTCARLTFGAQRASGAGFLLTGWLLISVLCAGDFLAWFGLGELLGGVRLACLSLVSFAVLQALFLGREHIRTLQMADALNTELAARVELVEAHGRQVEQLNTELRHQIADRSAQLFGAIRIIIDGGTNAPRLSPGEVVQERYRVIGTLGAGGMGTVYEVERIVDGRRLAMKVAQALDAVALARLAREAQIAAQVTHPNVVAVVDFDVASAGFMYLVMELVTGKSLHELPERYGNVAWALEVLAQTAAGLDALHACGIVHRDLKPANVLVTELATGLSVKITDFGISRIALDDDVLDAASEEVPLAPPTSVDLEAPEVVVTSAPSEGSPEVAAEAARRRRSGSTRTPSRPRCCRSRGPVPPPAVARARRRRRRRRRRWRGWPAAPARRRCGRRVGPARRRRR
ncbi:MAG: protein kinase [Kofleriaceae bacterium]